MQVGPEMRPVFKQHGVKQSTSLANLNPNASLVGLVQALSRYF